MVIMAVSAPEIRKVKDSGTIRIGATGKVSALMMQELDSNVKTSSNTFATKTQTRRRILQTAPVSISCGASTKKLQRMISFNGVEVTRSSSIDGCDRIKPGSLTRKKKKKSTRQGSQQIPMMESEDMWIDKTPIRGEVLEKKVAQQIVESVDLKCGDHQGDWSNPISNQLRRLSFSKLSG